VRQNQTTNVAACPDNLQFPTRSSANWYSALASVKYCLTVLKSHVLLFGTIWTTTGGAWMRCDPIVYP
jgi:hypothetical protein